MVFNPTVYGPYVTSFPSVIGKESDEIQVFKIFGEKFKFDLNLTENRQIGQNRRL